MNRGTFMSDAELYRVLLSADSNNAAAINGIPEFIDMSKNPSIGKDLNVEQNVRYTKDNLLHIQVIVPPEITKYDVEVWGTMDGQLVTPLPIPNDGRKWSVIDTMINRPFSTFFTIPSVPHGEVKIIITNVTGSFALPVYILCSRSA
jgi:hypothetical protein